MKTIGLLFLLVTVSVKAQLPIISGSISIQNPSSSGFFPTNVPNPLVWWGEMQSFGGKMWGPTTGLTPVGDNVGVIIWTNLANHDSGNKWTASATNPTNFLSGGGGLGTSPRILYTSSTLTRFVGGSVVISPDTNIYTMMFVMNCGFTASSDIFWNGAGTVSQAVMTSTKAIKMQNNSVSFTGPTTLVANQWYIVTLEQSGATGTIFTNGVQYATGSLGTIGLNATTCVLCNGGGIGFNGNIARVWGWLGNLSPGDHANAVAQCKTDFHIQ